MKTKEAKEILKKHSIDTYYIFGNKLKKRFVRTNKNKYYFDSPR